MKGDKGNFVINASRIGSQGGLRAFTEVIMGCLAAQYDDLEAVLPYGVPVPSRIKARAVPKWLSSSSRVSRLRPVLWLMYVTFLFPAKRSRRVFSTTHQVLPLRKHQVVTVHDLRPYFEPDTWTQQFYFHFMLPRALRRCDGILTVSETSKRQIASIFDLNEAIIHVVPNAVDLPDPDLTRRMGESDDHPYLLMVGASWKHKNAVEVLEQHALWEQYFRLKIVAGVGQYRDQLQARTVALGISDLVDILGGVTDAMLAALYRGCSALVYPSTMEGFGLPPLEAMAWGKPTIVSDIPVFRELFGNVPFYVHLGSRDSWKQAIDSIIDEKSTSNPAQMRARLALAASFSRKRTGIALTQALNNIWHLEPRAINKKFNE